jgi:uncharacterized protein YutE (UPF0331/DUF86 family)
MVDRVKIDQMLSNLRGFVAALRELGEQPKEGFLRNADKVGNAKYHFVIAIECCIDIANHIISSENYRFPKDNADSFAVLTEQGVVPADLLESLRAMARFRNRLVHLYWDVEDERVFEYLQAFPNDFDRNASAVAGHAW